MEIRVEVNRESSDYWFAMVDIDVIQDVELSPEARWVYAVVCTYASKMGGKFWPGIERVSQTAGLDIEAVEEAYRELESKRILSNARRRCIGNTHSDEEG